MEKDFAALAHRWDAHEMFYKNLYAKKMEGPKAYQSYLNSLDKEYIRREYLTVPELGDVFDEFPEVEPIFSTGVDIAVWKHSRYTPTYFHSHTYFEIICVVEGSCINRVGDKTVLEMKAGDICILPDGVKHSIEAMADEDIILNISLRKSTFHTAFYEVLSDDSILSNFFRQCLQGTERAPYLYFKTETDSEVWHGICQMYLEYYNHRKYYDKSLHFLMMYTFLLLIRNFDQYYVSGQNKQELELLSYLRKNFMDTTLSKTAAHFGYSEGYLSRLVVRLTGKNFTKLIQEYRLNATCRLLKESTLKISEISEVVGYRSLEHFNRQFRNMYNMTPSEYRSKNVQPPQRRF